LSITSGSTLSARRPSAARALTLAALLVASGCTRVLQGNGVFAQQERSVAPFSGVQVEDGIAGIVTAGGAFGVQVSGDANVVDDTQTEVIADPTGAEVLRVRVADEHYVPIHPLTVVVTLPALSVVRARSAASVTASAVAAGTLTVEASGGGAVTVSGAGGATLEATVAGSARGAELHAGGYPVETAHLALSGGSRAEVDASAGVDGTAAAGCAVVNDGAGACGLEDPATQAPVRCGP